MTAQEALERWEIHGDGPHLPQIYRDMGLTRLRILVAEEAKPSLPSAIDRMPVPKLTYNPLDRLLGRETPPAAPAAPTAEPLPQAPRSRRDKALTNPARLRTPARKRASFRYHLSVCGCVAEAAARAQVPAARSIAGATTCPGLPSCGTRRLPNASAWWATTSSCRQGRWARGAGSTRSC